MKQICWSKFTGLWVIPKAFQPAIGPCSCRRCLSVGELGVKVEWMFGPVGTRHWVCREHLPRRWALLRAPCYVGAETSPASRHSSEEGEGK